MSERNDTLVDLLRALGFVLAVVLGGLIIAGTVDSWNAGVDAPGAGSAETEEPSGLADD